MAVESKFHLDFHNLIDPEDYFAELREPIGVAATGAVRSVMDAAKAKIRGDVRQHFRNRMRGRSSFEKSFQVNAFPREGHSRYRFSYQPAGQITAEADWADVFEEGKEVRSSNPARWLAIPTEEAERLGLDYTTGTGEKYGGSRIKAGRHYKIAPGRKARVSQTALAFDVFGHQENFILNTPQGNFVANKDKEGNTVILFTLKRQVQERKLLSITEHAEHALNVLPLEFYKKMPNQ